MGTKKNLAREALLKFMQERRLKAHPWAQKAGIRSSTLYNFMGGKSAALTTDTLQKLAKAADSTVDELLGNAVITPASVVEVVAVIGIYGRLFEVSEKQVTERPPGVPISVEVLAARIDGDGLHPVPPGWLVFYERERRDPMALLGKLAVVRVAGARQEYVREIRRGAAAGLFTLAAWNASPIEDVEIESAHAVLAIAQPVDGLSPSTQ
jgi:DNA-binding Xre family transcriptional regulator